MAEIRADQFLGTGRLGINIDQEVNSKIQGARSIHHRDVYQTDKQQT